MSTQNRIIPLYPFLTAIYPILFLLSVNVTDVGLKSGFRSAALMLAFAIITFAIALVVTHNAHRSALTSFIITLCFFLIFFVVYAPAYHALREVSLGGETLGRHRYLIPAAFLLLVAAGVTVIWFSRGLTAGMQRSITRILNLVTVILVLIPSFTIIAYAVKKQHVLATTQDNLPAIEQSLTTKAGNVPDIYYLILDMHTSDAVMQDLMNYDDSAFTRALEERGFFVAKCARSNYPNTQYSITSSLNMNYLQEMTDAYDIPYLYPLLQSSLVQRTLSETGYKVYAFESGYPFTELVDADKYFSPVMSAVYLLTYPGLTTFESLLMQVSGGRVLYESREQLSQKMQYIIDAPYVEYRDRIIYALDTIPALVAEPGPKFVFAHILAPHDPFVFDEDGGTAFRRTPFSMDKDPEFGEGYGWEPYSEGYINEIIYLHKLIISIVDKLQQDSQVPPVIIIQGDHGIPRLGLVDAQYEIYSAYYVAGVDTTFLYDTITPVNTFRLIFNALFGSHYEKLPEVIYQQGDDGAFQTVDAKLTCPAEFDSLTAEGEDQITPDD